MKTFLKCIIIAHPYSFTTIDTRPTATIQFKKNFNEPIRVEH